MACDRGARGCANAAKRNGIAGHASRYLNTLGSWSSYRDLESLEEIPQRLAGLTESFFGLKGLLSGRPRLAGIAGAVLAVHAVEQATGSLGTMAMRTFGRGKPIGKYRGVILRQTEPGRWARGIEQVTGGRVSQSENFYFFESGRTWRCTTLETTLGDTQRTLTNLRSFSLPGREFYFDRKLEPQQAVDVALGERDPDTIPGFIGSVNELENTAIPLGSLKRSLFLANWLLVDDSERDGGPDYVDYDALGRGTPPGGSGSGGYYHVNRPLSSPYSPGGSSWSYGSSAASPSASSPVSSPPPANDPATLRSIPLTGVNRPAQAVSINRTEDQPRPIPGLKPAPGDSTNGRTLKLNIDGQDRQVVVERVMTDPIRQTKKAEARYYDDELGVWRRVVDDGLRVELARAVEGGTLSIDKP